MSKNVKDCPLNLPDWVKYIQNWASRNTTIALSKIASFIAIIIFLGSLTYLANLTDNISTNLNLGRIDLTISYLILLIVILIIMAYAGYQCVKVSVQLNSDMQVASRFILIIIGGDTSSNEIREEWLNEVNKMKKLSKKIPAILNNEEKKKFLETLLIVAGLLTVFSRTTEVIPLFTLFIISVLSYLIYLAIIEKIDEATKLRDQSKNKIRRSFISISITASFAAMVVLITLQGMSLQGLLGLLTGVMLIGLYITLALVLYVVLYKE